METTNFQTDIVILGAGIGGYETFCMLNRLLKRAGLSETVTLVDQNNYFVFTPLLHEVATGSVEPSHVTIALRAAVYKTPHHFIKARVEKILPEEHVVVTDAGQIKYRFCVVALGSGVNFFNTMGAKENSYTVRSLDGAGVFHKNFISALESPQTDINISVIGAGYTGIEVAGQLMSFVTNDVAKLYPNKHVKIRVIENMPTILSNLPASVQERVRATLQARGVEFLLGSAVTEVKTKSIIVGKQEFASDFTIWCAGVKNNADQFLFEPYQEKGRVVVNGFLQHQADSHLYAIGDMARFCNLRSDIPAPPLGEVAYKEGRYVAHHIIATLRNTSYKPFHFTSRGMLIPIGDWYGILTVGKRVIYGKMALVIRKLVYLYFMPGIGNKLRIFLDWTLHHLGFRYSIDSEK